MSSTIPTQLFTSGSIVSWKPFGGPRGISVIRLREGELFFFCRRIRVALSCRKLIVLGAGDVLLGYKEAFVLMCRLEESHTVLFKNPKPFDLSSEVPV